MTHPLVHAVRKALRAVEVLRFVEAYRDRSSGLSVREAMKNIRAG